VDPQLRWYGPIGLPFLYKWTNFEFIESSYFKDKIGWNNRAYICKLLEKYVWSSTVADNNGFLPHWQRPQRSKSLLQRRNKSVKTPKQSHHVLNRKKLLWRIPLFTTYSKYVTFLNRRHVLVWFVEVFGKRRFVPTGHWWYAPPS